MTEPAESITHVETIRSRAGAKRVAFVSGNFNVVHPGHLRLLRFAAECGDFLVVGVNSQGTDGAHVPEQLRLEGVRSISFVDYAFLLDEPPEEFVGRLRPTVVVKGKEHETRYNAEQPALDSYGGRLLFGSGEISFSSVDLLKREFREFNHSSIVKPMDFPKRHGFTMETLRSTMQKFKGMRAAVIGDLIVDEYINCEALGLSQEDPTVVVSPIQYDKFIGGAAIVSAHVRGMGSEVHFLSVAGRDVTAEFAKQQLDDLGIESTVLEDGSRPTPLKQRFRAGGKTLLRVSHLRQHDVGHALSDRLFKALQGIISRIDILIFADFNYGCLPQALVSRITALCSERGVKMVADSQSSSQVGDISRFKGMLLVTPTEREARLAVRDFGSGLVVLAEALRKQAKAQNVVITLGVEGALAHCSDVEGKSWITDRLPAFNTAPKDPAGAGDCLFACASLALVAGADLWQSAYLGSLAAGCQVGRIGNLPLSPRDLEAELAA